MPQVLLDAAGRPRSPATLPGFHADRTEHDCAPLIVVLWRAGLRIC